MAAMLSIARAVTLGATTLMLLSGCNKNAAPTAPATSDAASGAMSSASAPMDSSSAPSPAASN